ncbi:TetR/AcrR family transcriptional regulator [Aldersonia sp. NBC_00410]|uniref:TetR/AcrR family transcriptional regulator n=1 Tax=Aldersonia sp. NBC_00410 TaxID=2975954 RepID=UPI0022559CFE|nr:TetR/AcrR family transcriptional regulator [Aldersonia sp. NBC_00410]MCX5044776.1 TetR/AcrR family transcriptional regulator [Aldersonia sp. NBC_00410]
MSEHSTTTAWQTEDQDNIDPRRLRSRARLLDAATELLLSGGVDAVTIDAVTRSSGVARTTLYRHFPSSTELLAAAFERLVPPVSPPPQRGSLRDRLVELVGGQAALIEDVPIQVAALAWLALGSTDPQQPDAIASLRSRIIEQYRMPFDELLSDPETVAELGEFDRTLAVCQLIGPIVFSRIAGLPSLTQPAHTQIVDDFLTARRARA